MRMPTNIKVLFSLVAVLGILCVALAVSGAFSAERRQEERVTLSQVPAPVRATIEQEVKAGGTLKEIERISDEGKTAYAARIAVNGKEEESVIGEDGKVIRRGAAEDDDDD